LAFSIVKRLILAVASGEDAMIAGDHNRMIIEGLSQADIIKKSFRALTKLGVEISRASGEWCMKKQPETRMLELYNVVFVVRAPEYRWHTMLRRGMLLETLDYLLGFNPGYTPKMVKFYGALLKKNRGFLPYSYGARIQGSEPYPADFKCNQINQWENVTNLLGENLTSRQGSLIIRRPHDTESRDTPCTWGYHFQVDSRMRLNLTTFMRSQDILYGLPFDLFSQSMLLEQMALALQLDTGYLTEVAANFHLYEPDLEKVTKRISALKDIKKTRCSTYVMEHPMKQIIMHRLDYVEEWPKNRYLKREELESFLMGKGTLNCLSTDYWFDYLQLIGIGSDT